MCHLAPKRPGVTEGSCIVIVDRMCSTDGMSVNRKGPVTRKYPRQGRMKGWKKKKKKGKEKRATCARAARTSANEFEFDFLNPSINFSVTLMG